MVKKWNFLAAPTLVANQNTGFASSCPLADSAELKDSYWPSSFLALLKPRKKVKNQYQYQGYPGQQKFINWPKRHLFLRDRKRARHTHLSLSASQSDWSIRFISSRARETIRIISIVPFCSYSVFRYVHYANQITRESNLSQRPQ